MSTSMSNRFRKRAPMKHFFAFLFLVLSLAGCGGGGANAGSSGSVLPSNKGSLTLSVKWPARTSRLIPLDANDVRFTITPTTSGTSTPAIWVSRPAGSNAQTSTVTSPLLAAGSYIIEVDAFEGDNVSGSGPSQVITPIGSSLATGSVTETVTAGAVQPFSVTLGSNLAKFQISGFPYYINGAVNQGFNIWVDSSGNLTTNVPGATNPTSLPIDSGIASPYTITVTPEDAEGNVLLLSSPTSGQTTITDSHPISGTAITVSTTGNTTTQTPPGLDQFAFTLTPTGVVATDSFTITYSDGSTTTNFPVAVNALASSVSPATLVLSNAPPQFDGQSAAGGAASAAGLTASAVLTEVDIHGNPLQEYNDTSWSDDGQGNLTFQFGSISNTSNNFIFSYQLNLPTTGSTPVTIAQFTSGQFPYNTAITHAVWTSSSVNDYIIPTFPTVGVNVSTFSVSTPSQNYNVTAQFGTVTGTFSPSFFTESSSSNLFTFTSSAISLTLANVQTQLTTQSGTISLGYDIRTASGAGGITASSASGTYTVNISPTGGAGGITIQ